jgi:hypothetical protein
MTDPIDDGGPAYPMPSGPEPRVDTFTHYNEGMSLRDHFAGLAMQGMAPEYLKAICDGTGEHWLLQECDTSEDDPDAVVSRAAYWLADAMLKARRAGQ